MPRQERVYFSIDRCLLRSYAEIMNKGKMITEPSPDQKSRWDMASEGKCKIGEDFWLSTRI